MITPRTIHDQQLAERYLAGQLTEPEQAAFERHYADHPDVLCDLQAVAGIKLGLALLRDSGELDAFTVRPRLPWRFGFALAATLLIAMLGLRYLRMDAAEPTVIAASATTLIDRNGSPLSLLDTVDVQHTRSDVDAVITKPSASGTIKLRLRDAFEPPPTRYRLELFVIAADETRRAKASVAGMELDTAGLLDVYLNPAILDQGSYEMQLLEDGNGAAGRHVGDFLIDIVADSSPMLR